MVAANKEATESWVPICQIKVITSKTLQESCVDYLLI
jgi:hypothetical protein